MRVSTANGRYILSFLGALLFTSISGISQSITLSTAGNTGSIITNPVSPISKDVEVFYTGLTSGDSIIIWSSVSGLQARNVNVSSTWFDVPRKLVSAGTFVNGMATYGFELSNVNSTDSFKFNFRIPTTLSASGILFVAIKESGATTAIQRRNISVANPTVIRRSYKWTGAVDSVWQTAGNWEPSRSSVHDSDYLIFDNVDRQIVHVGYQGAQFTQTISKLLVTQNTNVCFSNYTKSNGSSAKSTIKISNLYSSGLATSSGKVGFAGTDTLEIELQSGATWGISWCKFYTLNTRGTGGCFQLSCYNTDSNANIMDAPYLQPSEGVNINLGDGRNQTMTIKGIYWGAAGEVVIRENCTFFVKMPDLPPLTLYGRMSVYGILVNDYIIVSNEPASSSAADWNAWVPYLQIRSNAKGRGMIQRYSSISGGVLWEMYNSGNRAWRTVGFPMKNSVNISQITDDIVISGTNSGDNRDSFFSFNTSCSYCAPSIKYWDESTSAWADYTSGNTANKIPVGQGILLFFRGMGTQGLGNNLASATAGSMDFKGQIHSGSKTVNLSYSGSGSLKGYNLIANPYPANVDFNLITRSNVANKYLVYEPKQRMYNVYDKSSGSVVLTGSTAFEASTTAQSSIIEMGASVFMIATASSPSVTFDESDRVYTQPNVSAFRMTNNVPCNQLKIKLTYENESASPLMDKCLLEWNQSANGAKEGLDAMDMNKLYAGYLGVGTISADKEWLGIDRREDVVTNAITVPLRIKTLDTFGYKFTFNTCDQQDLYSVELLDAVTETKTKVSNESTYLFKRKSSDLQVEDNRFSLVITPTEQAGLKEKSTRLTEVVRLQPVPAIAGESMQISVGDGNDILGVALLDMQGRILNEVVVGNKNQVEFMLPSALTAGNYLLKVKHRSGEESRVLPVIK